MDAKRPAMYIIKANQNCGYLFQTTPSSFAWIITRELATGFHSKEEAKSYLIRNNLTGHIIPN